MEPLLHNVVKMHTYINTQKVLLLSDAFIKPSYNFPDSHVLYMHTYMLK